MRKARKRWLAWSTLAMPETTEHCSHCQEFGVEGHIAPRLQLHRFQTVEINNLRSDQRGTVLLHQRCIKEWLDLYTDHALASIDAAV